METYGGAEAELHKFLTPDISTRRFGRTRQSL
jgi:hypothetical protein